MQSETKYGHLIDRDDEDDQDDTTCEETDAASRVSLEHQTVNVIRDGDPDIRYQVVVSHGDHSWEPICTHAWTEHQLAESNQFDPMGTVEWSEVPRDVQAAVVDVVAGVDAVEELDPEEALGVELGNGGGEDA